ncbi:HEC/Ndc80p family-domain-containing protein [Rhodotorula diobovata]|uniref:Kinetochore protein NDC80 n=1 Tax=Rhodotorula diobovata TaxID=5288 RepID=A0A5C5FWN1_9BASI|nr:HEC/Ndc80p family-domain-containing protein [Rhodotorula diobovata]
MGDRRRTIQHNQHSSLPVPSSIPRPQTSLRQSLAPSTSRQSLAPGLGHSTGPFANRARASIAPGAYPSSSSQDSNQGPSQPLAGASQGSQFSQGHGGPAREPPMTASRAGHMYTSAGAGAMLGGSMSVARNPGALRSSMAVPGDYAPPSERRTSTYRRGTLGTSMGGPAAMASMGSGLATPGGHIGATVGAVRGLKDPRDPRPRAERERMAEHIMAFCAAHQHHVTQRELLTPTGPQFESIFKFLVGLYDPAIRLSPVGGGGGGGQGGAGGRDKNAGAKLADEVMQTLRLVQYPFADSITKSHLQAVGSQQSWPNMLAMLDWFVKVIEAREHAFASDVELHIPASDFADRTGEDIKFHAWVAHCATVYAKFLFGEGDPIDPSDPDSPVAFVEEEEALRETIERSQVALRERVEAVRAEHDELEREWKQLTAKPDPIHGFREFRESQKRDLAKADVWLREHERKLDNDRRDKAAAEREIEAALRDRDEKRALLARLDRQVKEQKLTPLEIQSLSSDRQNLTRAMHDVQSRYRAVLSKTMSLEIDLNKKIDEATALCGEYDDKAQQLGLLDGPVKGFEDVPFAQEVNGASEQPVPEGLAGVVKPALQALRTNTRNEVRDLSLQGVKVEEELTRIKEVLGDLGDREAQHEQELDVVDREKDQMQQAIDRETATSNAELDRLQNQVNAISATMEHALAVANHRYEQRVVERMAVNEQTSALRRANRQALEQALEQFMSYKEHMTGGADRLGLLIDEAVATV